MKPRIVLAIARKDLIDVIKNRTTLAALLTPIVLAIFFVFMGNMLGAQGLGTSGVAGRLYDPGNSGLGPLIEREFSATLTLAPSSDAVREAVAQQQALFGIVVPADYTAAIRAGRQPAVAVYYDAGKAQNAPIGQFRRVIENHALAVAGIQVPAQVSLEALNVPSPGVFDLRAGFSLTNFYSLFALLTAVSTAGLYLMPNLLVEEKEKKTLRSLIVSPATFSEIIAAKLLVGLVYTAVLVGIVGAINLPPRDALALLLVSMALSAVFFNLLGLLIGSIANQMTTANAYLSGVFLLAYFPMLLVLMPFFNVNEGLLGWVVHALPSYYFADLLRIAIARTPDLAQFALSGGICLVWIAAAGALSVWTLRRQQI
jgi:ABC-2 type transport system permease protein